MSNFLKDTPMDRPHPGGRAALFVPRTDAEQGLTDTVKNGSGMVGFGNRDGTLTIYFENNRFNDPALHLWQKKVFKAYDRMVNGLPTTSKTTCDPASVMQIGFVQGTEILVREMEELNDWLRRTNTLDSAPEGPEIHA